MCACASQQIWRPVSQLVKSLRFSIGPGGRALHPQHPRKQTKQAGTEEALQCHIKSCREQVQRNTPLFEELVVAAKHRERDHDGDRPCDMWMLVSWCCRAQRFCPSARTRRIA